MGLVHKVQGRLNWYRSRFQVNNPIVGRVIEMLGNKVRLDGLTYSVDCPYISAGHKSTIAFGLHEIEERALIRRWLPPHFPVIEFGGGLGVVSCLTNRKLQRPEQHIVVEANPWMIPVLDRNRHLNNCKFKIINRAIAYDAPFVELNVDHEFVGSAVGKSSNNAMMVEATNVRRLLDEANFDCAGIVCDIEGAEADIIQRELRDLGKRVRFLMAEMHPAILGANSVQDLLADLEAMGFTLRERAGDCVFYARHA